MIKYVMENKIMLFISYSSLEKNECNQVIDYIKSEGHKVWIAPENVPAGKDYADVIPDAIRKCDAFVVLLTEKSQASKWVPKELDQAITAGKTIVPFHMDESKYTDSFEFRLSNVQRIEAAGRMDEALSELGQVLKKIKDGTYDHLKTDNTAFMEGNIANNNVKKSYKENNRIKSLSKGGGIIIAFACILLVVIVIVVVLKNRKNGNGDSVVSGVNEASAELNPGEKVIEVKPGITEEPEVTGEEQIQENMTQGTEETGSPVYSVIGLRDSKFDREKAYNCAITEYEENKYNQYLSFYMSDIIASGGITDLGKQSRMSNVLRGLAGAYADSVDIELKDGYITTDSGLCTGDIVYAKCNDCGSNVRVWIVGQADKEGRYCMLGAIWNDDTDVYDGTHITRMYTKCDECPSDRMSFIGLHIKDVTHEPIYAEAKKGGPKHFVQDADDITSIYDRHKAIEAVKEYYKASENNTALMTSRVLKAAGLEAFPEILLTGEVRAILLANHYCEEKEIFLDGGYVTEEMGLLTGDMVVAYDDACENYLRWWILGEADEDGRFTAYSPLRDYDTEIYDGTDAVILKTQHESCASTHLRFFSMHMLNDDEQAKRIAEGGETTVPATVFIDDKDSKFDHKAAYSTAMAEYEDNKLKRWNSYMLSDIVAAGGIHDIGQQSKMSNIIRGISGTYAELIEDIQVEDGYYITSESGLCSGDMVFARCKDCGSMVRTWIIGQADENGRFALIGTIWEGDIDIYDGTHVSKAYTLCDECPSDRMTFYGLHICNVSKEPVYGKAKEGSPLHMVTEKNTEVSSTDGAAEDGHNVQSGNPDGATKKYNYDRTLALEAAKQYYNAQENNSALLASRVVNAAGIKAMPDEVYVPTVREVLLLNYYCEEFEIVPDQGFITENMGVMTGDLILGYDYPCDIYLRYWVVGEADEDGRFTLYSKTMEGDIDTYDGKKPALIKSFCDKCPSEHCKYMVLHMNW